jgi:hypothetical protein
MVTNVNKVRMNQRARTKTWGEAKGLARGKNPNKKKNKITRRIKKKKKKGSRRIKKKEEFSSFFLSLVCFFLFLTTKKKSRIFFKKTKGKIDVAPEAWHFVAEAWHLATALKNMQL